jgi:hypothetical protein
MISFVVMGTCCPYMSSLNCCYQTKYCCDEYMSSLYVDHFSEPVSVDLFRSPEIDSQPGGPVRQPYLAYRPARLHRMAESIPRNRFLGSINVYIYGLRNLRIYAHHVVCEDGGGGTSCFPLLRVSMYSPTTFSYSSSWLFIQHLKPVLPALSALMAARSVRTCA